MKLTCTGRKVSLKEAFLQRAQTKLAKLDKFFSPEAQAQVTVTVEKDWQTVELTVKDKGYTCRPRNLPIEWRTRWTPHTICWSGAS